MTALTPTILSIAGSDPCGGAGIQADLKTFTAIGVYGAAAITCLTVQNSRGVQEIIPLDPSFVKSQIEAIFADHSVTHIKIGMIGTLEIAKMIADTLTSFPGEVIHDPVLTATAGQELFESENIDKLGSSLLNKVTVLTPNKFELELLGGRKLDTEEELVEVSKKLLESFSSLKALLVKGGHFKEEESTVTDFMITQTGEVIRNKRKRHKSVNLHGTGCTYASAFASYHSLTNNYQLSFEKTGRFMDELIEKSMNYQIAKSKNNSPLHHHLLCRK